jgi:hypothetical protein
MFFNLLSIVGIFYLIFNFFKGKNYTCPKCFHSIRKHHKIGFRGCSYIREYHVKDWQSNNQKYTKTQEFCYCPMTRKEIKNHYLLKNDI